MNISDEENTYFGAHSSRGLESMTIMAERTCKQAGDYHGVGVTAESLLKNVKGMGF